MSQNIAISEMFWSPVGLATVRLLFLGSHPLAVAGLVVAHVAEATDTHSRRALSHVGAEVYEAIGILTVPAFADSNAPAAVVFVMNVSTAPIHRHPRAMCGRAFHAMRSILATYYRTGFTLQASAAFCSMS